MEAIADNANASGSEPLTLGQVLARERERQGLSRGDIAQRLHMSPGQVESLESGDYGRLPTGMFLRGFVRNYAKTLGLAPESVLPLLAEARPRDPLPGIVVPTQNIRFDPLGDRLASPYMKAAVYVLLAAAVALAAIYWWLFVRPAPPAQADGKAGEVVPGNIVSAPLPPETPPAPPKDLTIPVEPPNVQATPESAPAAPARGEAGKMVSPLAGALPRDREVAAQPGQRALTFRFKGDSWVEVRDTRSGRLLLTGTHAAGSEAQVNARPPFSVVVGNAANVQLTIDNQAFSLEPHSRVGVARFTIE